MPRDERGRACVALWPICDHSSRRTWFEYETARYADSSWCGGGKSLTSKILREIAFATKLFDFWTICRYSVLPATRYSVLPATRVHGFTPYGAVGLRVRFAQTKVVHVLGPVMWKLGMYMTKFDSNRVLLETAV